MKPYRLNNIVETTDGNSYLCVSCDVVKPPPGPGWAKTWTPREPEGNDNRPHNPRSSVGRRGGNL